MNLSLEQQSYYRKILIEQLVYFDEEKDELLQEYFPEVTRQRILVEKTLSAYCSILENVVSHHASDDMIHTFALIGSRVDLYFHDDQSTESYTFVFPTKADPDQNLISFLSPVGFQLLLSRRDEEYEISIPSGKTMVRVESILFTNHGRVK